MTTRLILLPVFGLPLPASAAIVQATYCVDWLVDYDDGATGDFYTGTDGPARGVMLEFSANGVPTTSYYTAWTGTDPGCVEIDIDDQHSYTIKVVANAYVNGNYVRVLRDIGGTPRTITWLTNHVPQDNVVYQTNIGPGPTTNVMGVASYALFRHNAGLTAETFDFVLEECNTPTEQGTDNTTSCYRAAVNEIRISDEAFHENHKFIITHEMGHRVADLANDDDGQGSDDTAPVDDCGPSYTDDGHAMPTKEFSSDAAVEGIAHFWSALALNDDASGADCHLQKHYRPDWDHDGSEQGLFDVQIFSCSGAIVVNGTTVANEFDYYGQYCTATGAQTNRSTEYDWLRALWDVRTQGAVSAGQIYDVWNAADPDTWLVNGTGTGGDFPAARMSSGAYAVGLTSLQTTWDQWVGFNGVDR